MATPLANNENPLHWSIEDVGHWLQTSCDFAETTIQLFKDNDVDGYILLMNVDHEALKTEFQIGSFGKRVKLLDRIADLRRIARTFEVGTTTATAQPSTPSNLLDGIMDLTLEEDDSATLHPRATQPVMVQSRTSYEEPAPIKLLKTPLRVWSGIAPNIHDHESSHPHQTSKKKKLAGEVTDTSKGSASLVSDNDSEKEDKGSDLDDVFVDVDTNDVETVDPDLISAPQTKAISTVQGSHIKQLIPPITTSKVSNAGPGNSLSAVRRIAPVLVSVPFNDRTVDQAPSHSSASSSASGPKKKNYFLSALESARSREIDVSEHIPMVDASTDEMSALSISPNSTAKKLSRGLRKHKHEPFFGGGKLVLSDIFFSQDKSGANETDSESDDWAMIGCSLRSKYEISPGRRSVVQNNMKRVLWRRPLFDVPGHTVFAPIKRRETDVPVLLYPNIKSPYEKGAGSTRKSTWDRTFPGALKNTSISRIELKVDEQNMTSFDFNAATRGTAREPVSNFAADDDPVLPLYGESDADDYTTDEELFKEVAREEQEKNKLRSPKVRARKAHLSESEVRAASEGYIADYKMRWEQRTLPSLDKGRYALYIRMKNQGLLKRDLDKFKDKYRHLSEERLKNFLNGIAEIQYYSVSDVRKGCKALDETLDNLCYYQWRMDIMAGDSPEPPSPGSISDEPQLKSKSRLSRSPSVSQSELAQGSAMDVDKLPEDHTAEESTVIDVDVDVDDVEGDESDDSDINDFIDDSDVVGSVDGDGDLCMEPEGEPRITSEPKKKAKRERSDRKPSKKEKQKEKQKSIAKEAKKAKRRAAKAQKRQERDEGLEIIGELPSAAVESSPVRASSPFMIESDEDDQAKLLVASSIVKTKASGATSQRTSPINIPRLTPPPMPAIPMLETTGRVPPTNRKVTPTNRKVTAIDDQPLAGTSSSSTKSRVDINESIRANQKEDMKGHNIDIHISGFHGVPALSSQDPNESPNTSRESSTAVEDDGPILAEYAAVSVTNWRERYTNDAEIIAELRKVRRKISTTPSDLSSNQMTHLGNTEPWLSIYQEYMEWVVLDISDDKDIRVFLRWRTAGNNIATIRAQMSSEKNARLLALKAAKREKRSKDAAARAELVAEMRQLSASNGRADQAGAAAENEEKNEREKVPSSKAAAPRRSKTPPDAIMISSSDQDSDSGVDEIRRPRTEPKPKKFVRNRAKSAVKNEDDKEETMVPMEVDSSTGSEVSAEDEGAITTRRGRNKRPRARGARNHFGDSSDLEITDEVEEDLAHRGKKLARSERNEAEDVIQLREKLAREEAKIKERIKQQEARGLKLREFDPSKQGEVLVNLGHEESEKPVMIPHFFSQHLKPHQIDGIRFMWRNVVMLKGGCILAHSMGLGKTFQVIVFIFILMREILMLNPSIPEHLMHGRVLLLVPPIVLENWHNEFLKWIPKEERYIVPLCRLSIAKNQMDQNSRFLVMHEWNRVGGVFLLGYSMFREFCTAPETDILIRMRKFLLSPGPSITICDEGHLLKNESSKLYMAVKKIESKARITMTGYPLQNRLEEYWAMVDFIQPNYLGDMASFKQKYSRPIERGVFSDSRAIDTKIASKTLRVLTELISSFVMRKDQSVLRASLPKKVEFVISCKLTDIQNELYMDFLESVGSVEYARAVVHSHIFLTICNHPAAFKAAARKTTNAAVLRDREGISNGDVGTSSTNSPGTSVGVPNLETVAPGTAASTPITDEAEQIAAENGEEVQEVANLEVLTAAMESVKGIDFWTRKIEQLTNDVNSVANSYKMRVLMDILTACKRAKEKVLVFSRSIPSLDFIAYTVQREGFNSMTIDGSTPSSIRQEMIDKFNNTDNYHLFLISSEAGSVGVNLVSATRVVILDVGWNPSHDEQAIARAFRYGQTKKVFVYRLQTYGTWEDRLYKTNLHKMGLSNRVIDKKNIKSSAFSKVQMKKYFEAPPSPASIALWATDENVAALFDKPDTEDSVLREVIEKNKDGLANIVPQTELIRELDSDLTEADMIEIRALINQEQRRIEGKPPILTSIANYSNIPPPEPAHAEAAAGLAFHLPVRPQPKPQPQVKPSETPERRAAQEAELNDLRRVHEEALQQDPITIQVEEKLNAVIRQMGQELPDWRKSQLREELLAEERVRQMGYGTSPMPPQSSVVSRGFLPAMPLLQHQQLLLRTKNDLHKSFQALQQKQQQPLQHQQQHQQHQHQQQQQQQQHQQHQQQQDQRNLGQPSLIHDQTASHAPMSAAQMGLPTVVGQQRLQMNMPILQSPPAGGLYNRPTMSVNNNQSAFPASVSSVTMGSLAVGNGRPRNPQVVPRDQDHQT